MAVPWMAGRGFTRFPSAMLQVQLQPREVLFRTGDSSDSGIYIVIKGTLGVFLTDTNMPNSIHTNTLNYGESVGDLDVVDGGWQLAENQQGWKAIVCSCCKLFEAVRCVWSASCLFIFSVAFLLLLATFITGHSWQQSLISFCTTELLDIPCSCFTRTYLCFALNRGVSVHCAERSLRGFVQHKYWLPAAGRPAGPAVTRTFAAPSAGAARSVTCTALEQGCLLVQVPRALFIRFVENNPRTLLVYLQQAMARLWRVAFFTLHDFLQLKMEGSRKPAAAAHQLSSCTEGSSRGRGSGATDGTPSTNAEALPGDVSAPSTVAQSDPGASTGADGISSRPNSISSSRLGRSSSAAANGTGATRLASNGSGSIGHDSMQGDTNDLSFHRWVSPQQQKTPTAPIAQPPPADGPSPRLSVILSVSQACEASALRTASVNSSPSSRVSWDSSIASVSSTPFKSPLHSGLAAILHDDGASRANSLDIDSLMAVASRGGGAGAAAGTARNGPLNRGIAENGSSTPVAQSFGSLSASDGGSHARIDSTDSAKGTPSGAGSPHVRRSIGRRPKPPPAVQPTFRARSGPASFFVPKAGRAASLLNALDAGSIASLVRLIRRHALPL